MPGTNAAADELYGIGDALRRAGHGVFQFAPDHVDVPTDEWPWMRELARRTGRTVSVNLNQPDSAPDLWRDVLGLLDDAAADGIPIVAQVAGRVGRAADVPRGQLQPARLPPGVPVVRRPTARRAGGSAPLARSAGESLEVEPDDGGLFRKVVLDKLDQWWAVADGDIDYEPAADASIGAVARRTGQDPVGLVIDQLLAHDGHGMILTPFFNYAYGNLDFTYEAHLHPGTRMGLADAGAHCGVICDGGTPTFMLTHWTRDRTRGPKLPLEHVVHRQTRQTAELYGLGDRGLIAAGHARRPERDRLRAPHVRPAPHGARPARRCPPVGAEGERLRRHVRRRRAHRRPRRVHRRPPRPPPPRPPLTSVRSGAGARTNRVQPGGVPASGGRGTAGSRS